MCQPVIFVIVVDSNPRLLAIVNPRSSVVLDVVPPHADVQFRRRVDVVVFVRVVPGMLRHHLDAFADRGR